MKNLEVREFSLKQIVENLGKIPKDGGAKFGDEVQKLTAEQKKDLLQKVSKFNEYGKVLRCETALMEMAKTLSEVGQMAESYAMTESGDYLQSEVVKRDFKEVRSITKDFTKLARECYGRLQQLNALYEDMGRKMERYFEINSLDEIASAMNIQQSKPAPRVGESAEELEGGTESEPLMEHKKKELTFADVLTEAASRKDFATLLNNAGFKVSDTPTDAESIKSILKRLPINSDVIFYDGNTNNYQSGIPPFMKLHKEKNNATGRVSYTTQDNREQFAGHVIDEKDIDMRINAILRQLKLLNKVAIKSYQSQLPNVPSAVGQNRGVSINKFANAE